MVSLSSVRAAVATDYARMKLPPPIGREGDQRLASARAMMQRQGIGAIVIEPGASLDYFTGVQWWRSERLTAAVIPAEGDPIIVTPFFERPSVEESLKVPAEIRTWNEDEDRSELVAGFLAERKAAASPIGFEETNRFFILDRLRQQLPQLRGQRQPGGADPSNAQVAGRAGADAVGGGRHDAAYRALHPQVREGFTPAILETLFNDAIAGFGGTNAWTLILARRALCLGTGKPQELKRGDIVLLDCGCSVNGYQADISAPSCSVRIQPPSSGRSGRRSVAARTSPWLRRKSGSRQAASMTPCGERYESWGYGPRYKLPGLSHRTGHGIGMEGHEPVNLVHGETTRLAPGMCFSNEPGIYLPGKFGVRLEDCFYMTASGPRYFSPAAEHRRPLRQQRLTFETAPAKRGSK